MTPGQGATLAALAALAAWRSGAGARRAQRRLGLDRAAGAHAPAGTTGRPPPVVVGVAAVGVAVLASLTSTVVAAAAALAAASVPLVRARRQRAAQARLRRRQVPAALDRMGAALRSGSSLPTALADAGADVPAPLGPELAALAREADGGRPLVDVLDRWSATRDDAGTRLATTAVALATAVGATPGRAVEGVAATLRERHDLADERLALASQARFSALVLSVAPLGFGLVLGLADGAAGRFLLGTPAGGACLAAGVGLDAAGAWWMTRLTRGHDA